MTNFAAFLDGVYSNNYTSSQGTGGLESVARIPYFKLVKRLNEKRFIFAY